MFIAAHKIRQEFASNDNTLIACDWKALRGQLLLQWHHLSSRDLDITGGDRHKIANLIERKYGIAARLIETYLKNFERTMPLPADGMLMN